LWRNWGDEGYSQDYGGVQGVLDMGESIEVVDVSEYVIFYKSDDSIAIVM